MDITNCSVCGLELYLGESCCFNCKIKGEELRLGFLTWEWFMGKSPQTLKKITAFLDKIRRRAIYTGHSMGKWESLGYVVGSLNIGTTIDLSCPNCGGRISVLVDAPMAVNNLINYRDECPLGMIV